MHINLTVLVVICRKVTVESLSLSVSVCLSVCLSLSISLSLLLCLSLSLPLDCVIFFYAGNLSHLPAPSIFSCLLLSFCIFAMFCSLFSTLPNVFSSIFVRNVISFFFFAGSTSMSLCNVYIFSPQFMASSSP